MDLQSLANQSPKIMSVLENIKSDPNFLEELKENPKAALDKIGVELNDEELALVQKFEGFKEFEDEVVGIFNKIKGFLGFKESN